MGSPIIQFLIRMKKTGPGNSDALIESVIETLEQGETMLTEISDEVYTRRVPIAFNASIGAHYRHCLDHFRSLLDSAMTGDLNYDHRERGTLIENDRFAALNATRELREGYERLDPIFLPRPLAVTCKISYATNGSQDSPSSVGREIMYSVAHAVHHYALIGVMGGIMGLRMPPGFGVAPSTLKHQTETAGIAPSVPGPLTWRHGFEGAGKNSGPKARPHPGPLPRGEGESLSACSRIGARDLPRRQES